MAQNQIDPSKGFRWRFRRKMSEMEQTLQRSVSGHVRERRAARAAAHRRDVPRLQEQGRYLRRSSMARLSCGSTFSGRRATRLARLQDGGEMQPVGHDALQQDDFAMVLELLKKAEILTERDWGRAACVQQLGLLLPASGQAAQCAELHAKGAAH